MDWQLALTGLGVAAAAAYVARRAWRTWGRKASGCGGCGAGCKGESRSPSVKQDGLIPADRLVIRRRDRE